MPFLAPPDLLILVHLLLSTGGGPSFPQRTSLLLSLVPLRSYYWCWAGGRRLEFQDPAWDNPTDPDLCPVLCFVPSWCPWDPWQMGGGRMVWGGHSPHCFLQRGLCPSAGAQVPHPGPTLVIAIPLAPASAHTVPALKPSDLCSINSHSLVGQVPCGPSPAHLLGRAVLKPSPVTSQPIFLS